MPGHGSGVVGERAPAAAEGPVEAGLPLEPGASVPGPPAPAADVEGAGMFGRGLLYVAVWALQLVSAVVVYPVLAYLMPAEEFGRLASAISLSQVLVVLAVVGFDQAVILLRAESGHDGQARALVALGFGLAAVVTALVAGTAPLWSGQLGFDGTTSLVLITLGWTVPAAGLVLSTVLLLSQDRLKAFSVVNVLYGVGGQLVGVVVLVLSGSGQASTYAIGNLVALTASMLLGFALVRPAWRGITDVPLARRALKLGLPLMISSIAVYVLNAGDRLVIQRVLGAEEVGRYQIAYNVGNVAIILLGLASMAWAPQIAAVRDEVRRWALIGRSRDALLRLMVPVILGITLGAPVALGVAAPASFRPADLVLVTFLVAAGGFPVLIGNASARALITLERTRGVATAALVAAVVNVVLNLVLLPVWGLSGAAVATLIAFTVQTVIHRLALPKRVVWPRIPWRLQALAGGALAVSALTTLLPHTTAWNVARFAGAIACLPWFVQQLRIARAGDQPA